MFATFDPSVASAAYSLAWSSSILPVSGYLTTYAY